MKKIGYVGVIIAVVYWLLDKIGGALFDELVKQYRPFEDLDGKALWVWEFFRGVFDFLGSPPVTYSLTLFTGLVFGYGIRGFLEDAKNWEEETEGRRPVDCHQFVSFAYELDELSDKLRELGRVRYASGNDYRYQQLRAEIEAVFVSMRKSGLEPFEFQDFGEEECKAFIQLHDRILPLLRRQHVIEAFEVTQAVVAEFNSQNSRENQNLQF